MIYKKHLERLRKTTRRRYHPLIHRIHKKHKISKKTLFYVKEYGPHSNVSKTIIKESIRILLFVSLVSSLGGITMENIKGLFISIVPLVILLPILNGSIGNYGTIFSSRFSTILYEGKFKTGAGRKELRELFIQIVIIAVMSVIISSLAAIIISIFSGHPVSNVIALKILLISISIILLMILLLFLISILAGVYYFKKGEDPNNFLIPITTSIADFGSMLMLSLLVSLFF